MTNLFDHPKRKGIIYHCTTPKKIARCVASGCILSPVRGFSNINAAKEWCKHTGRTIILELEGFDLHKLPDHNNQFGTAWWNDGDISKWKLVYEV